MSDQSIDPMNYAIDIFPLFVDSDGVVQCQGEDPWRWMVMVEADGRRFQCRRTMRPLRCAQWGYAVLSKWAISAAIQGANR